MILAIDPGVRGCGCALFDPQTKRLSAAAYVKGTNGNAFVKDARAVLWAEMARAVELWCNDDQSSVHEIAIELPRVYQGAKQKGDPNDLIDLAAVVGALVMIGNGWQASVKVYYPYEWKGQVPKQIHHDRARARLDATEMAAVELPSAKSLQHNVWDAVALGLTHLRRM